MESKPSSIRVPHRSNCRTPTHDQSARSCNFFATVALPRRVYPEVSWELSSAIRVRYPQKLDKSTRSNKRKIAKCNWTINFCCCNGVSIAWYRQKHQREQVWCTRIVALQADDPP
eukprot:725182-Amphidinium_carterae.1